MGTVFSVEKSGESFVSKDEREKGQRRVYVLPADLVERIVEYQSQMGLQSEVEAVRRLLDEALMHRDQAITIARRFALRMKESKILSDIARDVLVGHPKVTSINFEKDGLSFTTKDGDVVDIYGWGGGRITPSHGDPFKFDKNGVSDDEIPF